MASESDQCALGPDGKLLHESEIVFYHDRDDDIPISGISTGSTPSQRPRRHPIPSAKLVDKNNAATPELTSHRTVQTESSIAPKRTAEDANLSADDTDHGSADLSKPKKKCRAKKGLSCITSSSNSLA